ncbi:MAG: Cys-tRNA(Pro) deacylase [Clostridiales bacterium]|nr:Cys-tRNA(Pro) deacylase [Clostridiales bacterium]HAW15916.1 Cys-tRNA(Pro) deacylase [Clostridiales bacterium]
MKKTNAMRMLDKAGVKYEAMEYVYDENDLDGHHVAEFFGLPYENVFKTLVARGDSGEYMVFCLSVDDEVDLKKAARLAGEKRVEMIHVKDLLNVTGYIRGGCSPIGMKKKYKTFFDEMILLLDEIYVSAGQRGMQLKLDPQDLIDLTEAKVGELT